MVGNPRARACCRCAGGRACRPAGSRAAAAETSRSPYGRARIWSPAMRGLAACSSQIDPGSVAALVAGWLRRPGQRTGTRTASGSPDGSPDGLLAAARPVRARSCRRASAAGCRRPGARTASGTAGSTSQLTGRLPGGGAEVDERAQRAARRRGSRAQRVDVGDAAVAVVLDPVRAAGSPARCPRRRSRVRGRAG